MPIAVTQSILLEKRKKLEELQRELQALQRAELLALPKRVGLKSIDELVELLVPLMSAAPKGVMRGEGAGTGARKPRALITPDMRSKARQLLSAGTMTADEIARRVGVSTSFVNKLKATEGLTRPKRG